MSADVLQHFPQDGAARVRMDRCLPAQELEASFSVRLFPDGFSIGKPLENGQSLPPVPEATELLYPYSHTSEFFLRALDRGSILGGLLDDISCKFMNGCVVCEIHDYCVNAPSTVASPLKASIDWLPVIYKITLQPTMESIVKDISSVMNNTWTYMDVMEIESRILRTMHSELDLDPRSSSRATENKSMLLSASKIFEHCHGKGSSMYRRLRRAALAKARASSLLHGKKIMFEMPRSLTGEANLDMPLHSISSPAAGTFPDGHERAGLNMDKKLPILTKDDHIGVAKCKQEPTIMEMSCSKDMGSQQKPGEAIVLLRELGNADAQKACQITNLGKRKEPGANFRALLSIVQRHGFPAKKRKVEKFPEVKRNPPSWQLLQVVLANTSNEDVKDPRGCQSMAGSLAGGNVNAPKTRYLQFQRQIFQGMGMPPRRIRVRLVMCERGKDAKVEAVVQFGDDEDDASGISPHHVLPTLGNAHAADIFSKQFFALIEKEGFELMEDQIYPVAMQRVNPPMIAASTAGPLPSTASHGSGVSQLPSPRSSVNMPAVGAVGGLNGIPLSQLATQTGLTPSRMLPPGNMVNRHSAYFGGLGPSSSKPSQQLVEGTMFPNLPHQQAVNQQGQGLPMVNQLPKLSPTQQINPQLFSNHAQLQQLVQNGDLQQKYMGMGNLGMMGGLGGLAIPATQVGNVKAVVGTNNMLSSGLTSVRNMPNIIAMGQTTGLGTMGHNIGLGNLIGHQLRPISPTAALQMAAFSSKGHVPNAANTSAGSSVDTLASVNMPMSFGRIGRTDLLPVQQGSMLPLGSPKVASSLSVAGVGGYINSLQQSPQQSQLTTQVTSQVQQATPNSQICPTSQQLSGSQLSSQLVAGGLGSFVGGPGSPQLSSQSLGSVTGGALSMDHSVSNMGSSLPSSRQ